MKHCGNIASHIELGHTQYVRRAEKMVMDGARLQMIQRLTLIISQRFKFQLRAGLKWHLQSWRLSTSTNITKHHNHDDDRVAPPPPPPSGFSFLRKHLPAIFCSRWQANRVLRQLFRYVRILSLAAPSTLPLLFSGPAA